MEIRRGGFRFYPKALVQYRPVRRFCLDGAPSEYLLCEMQTSNEELVIKFG